MTTAAGERLLGQARRTLDEAHRLQQAVWEADPLRSEPLRLGVYTAEFTTQALASRVLSTFHERHPKARLDVVEFLTTPHLNALEQGDIHLGMVFTPVEIEAIDWLPLFNDHIKVVVPEHHSLAGNAETAIGDLRGEPFLLYPRDLIPDKYDEIVGFCRRAGFEPQVISVQPPLHNVIDRVAAGEGITLVPEITAPSHRERGVVFSRLCNPAVLLNIVLAWKKGALSPSGQAFLAAAHELAHAAPALGSR